MRQAHLPARERYILDALLSRADNPTGEIPARFQPRSHADEYFFGAPRRTVQRALRHLRDHGWVDWKTVPRGARGKPASHYELSLGRPCDCERIKRHPDAESREIRRHTLTGLSATLTVNPQPEPPAPLKRSREGGKEGKVALCTVCGTRLDPVLPAAGYRTHPCCDPDEKPHAAVA